MTRRHVGYCLFGFGVAYLSATLVAHAGFWWNVWSVGLIVVGAFLLAHEPPK